MNRLAPIMSSAKSDWRTPAEVLELVRKVAPIALDPCTTVDNPTEARAVMTLDYAEAIPDGLDCEWVGGDGLKHTWENVAARLGGLIYVNPPYGRDIWRWTEKCAEARAAEVDVIALLPARTDTRWWQDDCVPPDAADAVCFWRGRLTFVGAPAPAPFPSALVYWGPNKYRFADAFAARGAIWL